MWLFDAGAVPALTGTYAVWPYKENVHETRQRGGEANGRSQFVHCRGV